MIDLTAQNRNQEIEEATELQNIDLSPIAVSGCSVLRLVIML